MKLSLVPPLKKQTKDQSNAAQIRAICFDERSLVAGSLAQIQATSAEFICPETDVKPLFPKKTWLKLNIFHERTNQEQTVEARLINYFRKDGRWVYKLLWKELPVLLRS